MSRPLSLTLIHNILAGVLLLIFLTERMQRYFVKVNREYGVNVKWNLLFI